MGRTDVAFFTPILCTYSTPLMIDQLLTLSCANAQRGLLLSVCVCVCVCACVCMCPSVCPPVTAATLSTKPTANCACAVPLIDGLGYEFSFTRGLHASRARGESDTS